MALHAFTCEHCGKKSHRFLRPSQVGGAVECPSCKKKIRSGGALATLSAPAVSGGQKASCVIL
ncbi:MAG: hypothetical protein LBM00_03070 [Deltaproteobacteria bacterium]|nr:hypothetical protein [Deltaproteobacteria bacterium]